MSVLSGDQIEQRVEQGKRSGDPKIFEANSWDREGLRPAAYDLRIASDLLILPKGTRYWLEGPPGQRRRTRPFVLKPRDVAFVSSVEEVRMPTDLAGNVTPKARQERQGMLIMGGMLVDPGYRGRLHFQLANVGDEDFVIIPGETTLASLQLLQVEAPSVNVSLKTPGYDDLLEHLFRHDAKDPLPPLGFFSNVDKLTEQVTEQGSKLDSTSRSMDQLLVFGVFLVSITLFTVAAGVLIDAIAGGSIKDAADATTQAELTIPGLVVAGGLLAVVGAACVLMMRPVARVVAAREAERAAREENP